MKTWKTASGQTVRQILDGRCNVYLLKNGARTMLVDTSTCANWQRLERALEKMAINHIDWLFLTHAHFDHVENAERIRARFGAAIAMNRKEADIIASGKMEFPAGTNPVMRTLTPVYEWLAPRLHPVVPFTCDLVVEGRTDLSMLGFSAFFLPTPGHSSGSTSIIVENEIAICGDAAFGVFRGDTFPPFADNVPQLLESWESLVGTGCRVFLPGHGNAISAETLERSGDRRKKA